MNDINDLKNLVNLLEKNYKNVRIIDPINKTLLTIDNNKLKECGDDLNTYSFFNKIDDDYFSIKAYQLNKALLDTGHKNNNVYTISSLPFKLGNKPIVIEIAKEINEKICDLNINIGDGFDIFGELDREAFIDPITNTFNEEYLHKRLPSDINESLANKTNLTLIVVTIPNEILSYYELKKIYSEYGKAINKSIRGDDWVSRFQNDKFIVIIRNVEYNTSINICERIKYNILGGNIPDNINLHAQIRFCILDSFENGNSNLTSEKLLKCVINNSEKNNDNTICGCHCNLNK